MSSSDSMSALNLNPHKAARLAMCLYSSRYAAQNDGSMDFWRRLSESDKQTARDILREIELAPNE